MRIRASLLTLSLGLAMAVPAFAHAMPQRMNPKAGSVLKKAPSQISIWYDDSLQPGLTGAMVKDNGRMVNVGMGKVEGKDHKQLVVPLKKAGPGKYLVNWHAMSDDGHPTSGHFGFSVK